MRAKIAGGGLPILIFDTKEVRFHGLPMDFNNPLVGVCNRRHCLTSLLPEAVQHIPQLRDCISLNADMDALHYSFRNAVNFRLTQMVGFHHFLLEHITEHNISCFLHCIEVSFQYTFLCSHTYKSPLFLKYSRAGYRLFPLPCINIIQKIF